jgi:GTP pyrophosphokinase
VAVLRFEDIQERVESYHPAADFDLLQRAYVFSARAHRGQTRYSGEPYLIHPLAVAHTLAELRLDLTSVITGLLHDVVEDTLATVEEIEGYFGAEVAHIVDGVTKISQIEFTSEAEKQAENFRKMLLAMVDDIRVILVKLADRLHNMRTLEHIPEAKQQRIARETMEIYAPLAHRLGIGRLKSELEDLSLPYLDPEGFSHLVKNLEKRRSTSETFIRQIRQELEEKLEKEGIRAEITGRIKNFCSIYRKMRTQGIDVDEVYDYVAFRILAPTVPECYGALGIVHSTWKPVPGRIKDYIAMPKPNKYQSLHTSVLAGDGHPFEVQIRTPEMHEVAENGIAAHWRYKEEGSVSEHDAATVDWLRQVMEWQQDLDDPRDFLGAVKVDLYPEEVYAFSPKGKVLSFPRGATPLDFAYAIHTEVGHSCTGARINGRLVPLKTPLENGDIVEIVTGPNARPSRDWLKIVKTGRARAKIRAWVGAQERARSRSLGAELTDKELRRFKISLKAVGEERLNAALKELGFGNLDEFHASVGYGKVAAGALVAALVPEEERVEKIPSRLGTAVRKVLGLGQPRIKVQGIDDVMVHRARCCNPIQGDEIVGYISRRRGVAVHAVDCPNVERLQFDPERRVEVAWDERDRNATFPVHLSVLTQDEQGILAQIISAVAEEKTNIVNVEGHSTEDQKGVILLTVEVRNRSHADRVIRRVRKVEGVRQVERRLA